MKKDRPFSRRQFLLAYTGRLSAAVGQDEFSDERVERDLRKAEASIAQAATAAAADPNRPVFHFRPQARWMNDPHAPIFHQGWCHVFYQLNPFDQEWGHMYWGHARSRDLVHWEHRPIALGPRFDRGETHCLPGSVRLDRSGRPKMFYTSAGRQGATGENRRPNEQWMAIGSPDLDRWHRSARNPVLELSGQGAPRFDDDWRDPFLFEVGGRTYLILGALRAGRAVIPIYEATDPELERWNYRGIFHSAPAAEVPYFECPNFLPVSGRGVLLYAPYRCVEYIVGDFNPHTALFTPDIRGVLDPGATEASHFYASTQITDGRGRTILLGWVRGFHEPSGWNGCMALPRVLTVGPDARPLQEPLPELRRLRGHYHGAAGVRVNAGFQVLEDVQSDTLEIVAELDAAATGRSGVEVRRSADGPGLVVAVDEAHLFVGEQIIPYSRTESDGPVRIHLFVDKSVLEVFVDDGRLAVTQIIPPRFEGVGIAAFSEGEAFFRRLDIWRMQPIWQDRVPGTPT